MENFLMNEPNLVFLWSTFVLHAVLDSELILIDLNLYITKGFLFKPTRVCLNITGPGEVNLIIIAVNNIIGLVIKIKNNEPNISKVLFKKAFPKLSKGILLILINGMCPITSMYGWLGMYL